MVDGTWQLVHALLTFTSNFIGQIFHPIKFLIDKTSPVKISLLEPTGDIGEILPLVKISRYTVINKALKLYLSQIYSHTLK